VISFVEGSHIEVRSCGRGKWKFWRSIDDNAEMQKEDATGLAMFGEALLSKGSPSIIEKPLCWL
jgi:hypothetical protein